MIPMMLRRRIRHVLENRPRVRIARWKIAALAGTGPVMELGCGLGPNADYIPGTYLGIDFDAAAVREARRQHPGKWFLCADILSIPVRADAFPTVLFCAVLHELPHAGAALAAVQDSGVQCILVCDYDPGLRGWLKRWMDLFEPESRNWWHTQPGHLLPESGWSVETIRISSALICWKFLRNNLPTVEEESL